MKTEIISVGTELLMGYVVDTNAGKIAQELLTIGLGTYYQQTVGDNPERLREAIKLASERSDIIILTGGLGPTQDDITKQVAAEFLDDELVLDNGQLDIIKAVFKKRGTEPDENVYREALTFKHGQTLFNDVGLACGSAFKRETKAETNQHIILLPGVPYEMTYMLKHKVKPYLKEIIQKKGVIESLFMNFNGIGESRVAMLLNDKIQNQTNPTIAMYAKPRHITIRITASAKDAKTAAQMNQKTADEIQEILSENFIGYGEDQTIETYVVDLLKKKKLTLSIVEGFTSGLVMSSLTSIAGVSSIFAGGLVSLNTETSEKQFGLTDLKSKTPEDTAKILVEECAETFQTDIGLSVTAETILNTSGQLLSGTGYIAVFIKDEPVKVKPFPLPEKPQPVLRELLKNEALAFLKDAVE
ncbi:nicotinamide-nucleotide amidase [Alkalibacterium putridalgicola]|uniref:Putative competence-damage inducible protein n=1 Tax=Alkalibacterium putridalgicola TaxID=426703 RepID=A0A1H7QK60_9LACT|nr:CinA family nicotinamide mononucleotide deamidase-related protein [Alkalibacterium putridalgicola]GEK88440.1 putative competence-damage inducible protein [Alkalibacterium putridalgicola]SEL48148.1 nicotinamide-nucleotide amidase [Alkalibacterium putridalgicola]